MASHERIGTVRTTGPAVVGVALAIALPAGLALTGLFLLSSAEWVERMVCTFRLDGPCPGTATVLTVVGAASVVVAFAGLIGGLAAVRRRRRGSLFLPALTLIFSALAVIALLIGENFGNAAVELGGLAAGCGVLSLGVGTSRLLQAAVVAQAIDLATFGAVWQQGAGEANPLGRLIIAALGFGVDGEHEAWLGATIAGAILIAAKVALIGFLLRVSPYLHRYRRPVLVAAAIAGAIGATANLLVIL